MLQPLANLMEVTLQCSQLNFQYYTMRSLNHYTYERGGNIWLPLCGPENVYFLGRHPDRSGHCTQCIYAFFHRFLLHSFFASFLPISFQKCFELFFTGVIYCNVRYLQCLKFGTSFSVGMHLTEVLDHFGTCYMHERSFPSSCHSFMIYFLELLSTFLLLLLDFQSYNSPYIQHCQDVSHRIANCLHFLSSVPV